MYISVVTPTMSLSPCFLLLVSSGHQLFITLSLLGYFFLVFDLCMWCSGMWSLIAVTSLLMLLTVTSWIRDIIREFTFIHISILYAYWFFVISEALLFLSFFWSYFHITLPALPMEGLFDTDPVDLSYTNSLLLTNAAVCLSDGLTCRERILSGRHNQTSFIIGIAFISMQVKEYRTSGFYINDSVYTSLFFFYTGLHFTHVVLGLVAIGVILWCNVCLIAHASAGVIMPIDVSFSIIPQHQHSTICVLYWHLVEILWLIIYLILYWCF